MDFLLNEISKQLGDPHVTRENTFVLRNAGGRAHEALRSVMISQTLLTTQDIHVVHHTGCGM
ncbi:hypothetical protein FRC06_006560, partial [Ceratobasidium sp. 370]